MSDTRQPTQHLVERLAQAGRVVAVTGAGVSAASGIPTYRDPQSGYWTQEQAENLATHEAYDADPAKVTRWYDRRRLDALKVQPNPAHTALARLERLITNRGGTFTLFTQNIDGLHQRAGSRDLVEVHGSLLVWRDTVTLDVAVYDEPRPMGAYPPMSLLGNPLRPAVVWFGEALPTYALERAAQVLPEADVFLSIGTSGLVHPVAGFVDATTNAARVEINPEATAISGSFDLVLREPAEACLPAVVSALEGDNA